MNFNLKEVKEGFGRWIRRCSRVSLVLFAACMLSGLILLIAPSMFWVIVTGFFGVMWLSSVALHAFKRGRLGRANPFTALLALSALAAAGCMLFVFTYKPSYQSDQEPLAVWTKELERYLNDMNGEDIDAIPADNEHFFGITPRLYGTDSNFILTDEAGRILHRSTDWMIGETESLRALVCPSTYETGTGLMILLNEDEEVISAFQLDDGYFGAASQTGKNSLTIDAETPPVAAQQDSLSIASPADEPNAQTETQQTEPVLQAASSDDPLFDRYFPSFGEEIDRWAIQLVTNRLYVEIGDPSGADSSMEYIELADWEGETILRTNQLSSTALIQALNALTPARRHALKEYIAWLESAMNVAQTGDGDRDHPYRARILTRSDGQLTGYILYEYDSSVLFPNRQQYHRRIEIRNGVNYIAFLMIPAAIVFLAFWVFVDAKKRGQTAPALWAVLTLIGNVVTWIIYMLVRPQLLETPAGQPMSRGSCPICGTKLKSDFIACPGCGILLRSRCKSCGRALENDWSFCPYCTQTVLREIPSAEAKPTDGETAAE